MEQMHHGKSRGGGFYRNLGRKSINFLTILASDHDIVNSLNSDEITGRFALSSTKFQKHLNFPEVAHSLGR